MILFMIPNDAVSQEGYYNIDPDYKGKDLDANNLRLISWNEASYKKESTEIVKIQTIHDLFSKVLAVAQNDDVCKDMNKQFMALYATEGESDVFKIIEDFLKAPTDGHEDVSEYDQYSIFRTVYYYWPHPMIGNIVNSPQCRAQEYYDQYFSTWNKFPNKYMSDDTKLKIVKMISDPSEVGLKTLDKSGRDQVRICKDWKELARAVIGEVTTYITKMLEKIYALELCLSDDLLKKQKELITKIVEFKEYVPEEKNNLEEYFKNSSKRLNEPKTLPLYFTQYINHYFINDIKHLETSESQWYAFASIINYVLGEEKISLKNIVLQPEQSAAIKNIIDQCEKFPPTMLCAMIFNDLRKLEQYPQPKSLIINSISCTPITDADYFLNCTIDGAAVKDFLPTLKFKKYESPLCAPLGSWMRNEKHVSTITNRHFLMPLWAGPSGHANGLLSYYNHYFNSIKDIKSQTTDNIAYFENSDNIARVILPSMFAFWRLYYDKRISGVHTLAETYDAVFFNMSEWVDISKQNRKNTCNRLFNIISTELKSNVINGYTNVLDTVNSYGIYSAVGVMYRLYQKHCADTKGIAAVINKLKGIITANKDKFKEKKYDLTEWAHLIKDSKTDKPITESTTLAPTTDNSEALSSIVIEEQTVSQIQAQTTKPADTSDNKLNIFLEGPSAVFTKILTALETAQKNSGELTFNDSIDTSIAPPQCLTDKGISTFLGGMTFSNISDVVADGQTITFKADVDTKADCWNCLKTTVSTLQSSEKAPISCTVTEKTYPDCNIIIFSGAIDCNCSLKVGNIELSLNKLIIESGLNANYINSSIAADIKYQKSDGTTAVFDLTISQPLYTGIITINGCYNDGNTLTLDDVLNIFGLGNLSPSALIPEYAGITSTFGLQSVNINFDMNKIYDMGFVLTASEPWEVLEKKISFIPVFKIDISDPINAPDIYCAATGRWFLECGAGDKTSEFDVTVTSDLTLYAGLAEDSELNFSAFLSLFADGISFPSSLTFTDLSMTCNFKKGNYSFIVTTEDVLSFTVGTFDIGINSVSCSLSFINGEFGSVTLNGMLNFGKIDLNLYGSFSSSDSFSFHADAYNDLEYTFKEFTVDISRSLNLPIDPDSFPDIFKDACIRSIKFSYTPSESTSFIAAFDIGKALNFNNQFKIDDIKFEIRQEKNNVNFNFYSYVIIAGYVLELELKKNDSNYSFDGTLSLNTNVEEILSSFGIECGFIPNFILEFKISQFNVHFSVNDDTTLIHLGFDTNYGNLMVEAGFGKSTTWKLEYNNTDLKIDVLEMHVIGELVRIICPEAPNMEINNINVTGSSDEGLKLSCKAFGKDCVIPIYTPESPNKQMLLNNDVSGLLFNGTIIWIKIDQTILILNISKLGLGIDGSNVAILMDASLNISPLTLSLNGAGIGFDMSDNNVGFYISGFGVGFDNGVLSIGGGFSATPKGNDTEYTGMLSFHFKDIGATAVGSYSNGSMWAYLAIIAPLGGIPAFFVKGLAAGFGYNKKLELPSIENVSKYPLITAATKGFDDGNTLNDLKKYISDKQGQYFLTAGLKFTSFETITGFLLATVSFGKELELGLLGIGDLSVPPKIDTDCIARAQLAVKAALKPSEGIFSAEAQLTNESYILAKSCKLKGGFAAYLWFGDNKYSGDFVVTLGGYHPLYKKPDHYPVVPRLGINWQIDKNSSIIGELYFAITPSTLMAGGRLNATYSLGDLKAWFIAYTDFLMNWKPFTYKLFIGASVGASYTLNFLGIRKTFSVELSADLKLWGPNVQGELHISWFIISFTISFSTGKDLSDKSLTWDEFKNSFLIESSPENKLKTNSGSDDILTVSLDGISGQTNEQNDIVDPTQLNISLISKIPTEGEVRPVDGAALTTTFEYSVRKNNLDITKSFTEEDINQNLPAALWVKEPDNKLTEEPVKKFLCGKKLSINKYKPVLFPENRSILLLDLYENNKITLEKAFDFSEDVEMKLSDNDTITEFEKNEKSGAADRRNAFLTEKGYEKVSIINFVEQADDLFSEDIMIINS